MTPRLMAAPVAALYLGVSESMLRSLSIPRKILGGKRLYERADLDDFADRLSYEAEQSERDQWDTAAGIAR